MRYKNIYLIRYLEGERKFTEEVTVFNYYETEELFPSATNTDAIAKQFTDAYLESIKGVINNDYIYDAHEFSISRVCVDTEHIFDSVSRFARDLLVQANSVRGDDDSYDYFTDLVMAFEQICAQTKQIKLYNDTVDKINEFFDLEPKDELFYGYS